MITCPYYFIFYFYYFFLLFILHNSFWKHIDNLFSLFIFLISSFWLFFLIPLYFKNIFIFCYCTSLHITVQYYYYHAWLRATNMELIMTLFAGVFFSPSIEDFTKIFFQNFYFYIFFPLPLFVEFHIHNG